MGDTLQSRLSEIIADAAKNPPPPETSAGSRVAPHQTPQTSGEQWRSKITWILLAFISGSFIIAFAAFVWPGYLRESVQGMKGGGTGALSQEQDLRKHVRAMLVEWRKKEELYPGQNLKIYDTITANIKDKDLDAYGEELGISREASWRFISCLKPAFKGDVLQLSALPKYIARGKTIPVPSRKQFGEAVEQAVSYRIDPDMGAIVLLVQLPIFAEDVFQNSLFQIALDEVRKNAAKKP